MNNTNRNVSIFALLAFVLLIAAYLNHFNNGFHFDDYHTIVNNAYIRSLKNIPSFFVDPKMFSSDPAHWGLRSLVTTTLAIDYWLGGNLNPYWFQFSTFVWHVALCVILFFTYRTIAKTSFKDDWAAFIAVIAASWYGLHTANAETLNYIISRSDVLSTLLIVLSFFIYISWPAKRKYLFYVIPAFIGVFAKETVLVLVILLFFYIVLFERKLSIGDLFKAKNFKVIPGVIWQILPLIIVVVVTQIYTLTRITSIPGMSNPLLPYILTQTYVWVHYFIAFFLPVNLSADSDWTVIQNAFDERIIIGCIFIALLIITIVKTSVKSETKPIAFGLIWFAAALLPTSLAPFAEVTNDHRMYFPFIGLALSVVSYIGLLIKRYRHVVNGKRYFAGLMIIAFCVLGLNALGVYQRNKVWENDETLWRDVTIKSPANGRGFMNYGVALMDNKNYALAGYCFRKAKTLIPFYGDVYVNIGILSSELNKPKEAEENFRMAMVYAPNEFDSYFFYARYLLATGKAGEARVLAERALQLNPYSYDAFNILMNAYSRLKQWQLLKQTALQSLAHFPADGNAKAYLDIAQKMLATNNNAATATQTAADYLDLSLSYYNVGLYNECITACNKALMLKPDYADAYSNIGAAYNKLMQWDNGIAACKKALAINPSHKLAQGNLDFAEKQLKHP